LYYSSTSKSQFAWQTGTVGIMANVLCVSLANWLQKAAADQRRINAAVIDRSQCFSLLVALMAILGWICQMLLPIKGRLLRLFVFSHAIWLRVDQIVFQSLLLVTHQGVFFLTKMSLCLWRLVVDRSQCISVANQRKIVVNVSVLPKEAIADQRIVLLPIEEDFDHCRCQWTWFAIAVPIVAVVAGVTSRKPSFAID
jgi:hypothetical protein